MLSSTRHGEGQSNWALRPLPRSSEKASKAIHCPTTFFKFNAAHDLTGQRILLPRAAVARDLVPVELARRGAVVDVVEAYRTAVPEGAREAAAEIFGAARKLDWVTFTSSSTVRNLVAVAGAAAVGGVKAASIGPITSATARELGIEVTVEASVFTVDGLVEAILRAVSLKQEAPDRAV